MNSTYTGERTRTLDSSFSTLFIVVSFVNIGLIATAQLARGVEPSLSSALYVTVVPIMILVFLWWSGLFFDRLPFKLSAWLILFTLVFRAVFFVMTMIGIDRILGFNVFWLTLGEVLAPVPACMIQPKIWSRYSWALNRPLTKSERGVASLLSFLFAFYYLVLPWDWVRIWELLMSGGFA